jgi:hypothetical protein
MVVYGAAKGGCLALSRGLAAEGIDFGIKVNALGPSGETAASEYFRGSPAADPSSRPPELVAPVAAFLAHESCPCSGKYLEAKNGNVSAVFLGQTAGYTNPQLTLEDVAQEVDQILDHEQYSVVAETYRTLDQTLPHFRPYVPA